MERAEDLVVLQLEGAGSLELSTEVELQCRLNGSLLLELECAHLLLLIAMVVASGPCGPPRATGMVRVR